MESLAVDAVAAFNCVNAVHEASDKTAHAIQCQRRSRLPFLNRMPIVDA